ncbi:integrase arm-type DNA-binding domain-containing protein [Mesorhizobium sp. ASY16-5R]|uniref:integrase arm-type DNA-binding domain-containing protein n=1 Tax=Mesorhizobium sp. ASY16-5R TaxID=3445772 RepID=UPI003FA0C74B
MRIPARLPKEQTMPLLSDNFVASAVLPRDRDELIIRDSKMPGFALRLRRKADGKASKTFLVFQEMPEQNGVRKRRKIVIGDHTTFPADRARAEAQSMLQAIKTGDDPAAARAAKKAQPVFEDLIDEFETSHIMTKKPETQKVLIFTEN